jgi:hypothetical protein
MQDLEASVLRDTLITIPEIRELVAQGDQYKIFWEHVPENISTPYIVLEHVIGGMMRAPNSDAGDTHWRIKGVTASMAKSVLMSKAIFKLHRMTPVSNVDGVCPYASLTLASPYFDRDVVQNVPLFYVGGLYRLRLSYL